MSFVNQIFIRYFPWSPHFPFCSFHPVHLLTPLIEHCRALIARVSLAHSFITSHCMAGSEWWPFLSTWLLPCTGSPACPSPPPSPTPATTAAAATDDKVHYTWLVKLQVTILSADNSAEAGKPSSENRFSPPQVCRNVILQSLSWIAAVFCFVLSGDFHTRTPACALTGTSEGASRLMLSLVTLAMFFWVPESAARTVPHISQGPQTSGSWRYSLVPGECVAEVSPIP